MTEAWYRAVVVHAICCTLHLASTVFIFTYALARGSTVNDFNAYVKKDIFAFTDWASRCYNATTDSYSDEPAVVAACADDDTLYYINQQDQNTLFATPVNILVLAMAFTATSGLVHLLSAIQLGRAKQFDLQDLEDDSFRRLCYDYAVSAPCMLVVVNITFGANCVSGVIAAPLLLAVLLVSSHYLLSADLYKLGRSAFVIFGLLVSLYGVSLAPTIWAVVNVGSVAPPGVVVFLVGLLVAYSSFIVPYAYELVVGRHCIFIGYAALSVIAKAMLHAFLAVSVLQQSQLYRNVGVETGPPTNMGDEATAYMIVTIIPASGLLLFTLIRCYLDPLRPSRDTEPSAGLYLQLMIPTNAYTRVVGVLM